MLSLVCMIVCLVACIKIKQYMRGKGEWGQTGLLSWLFWKVASMASQTLETCVLYRESCRLYNVQCPMCNVQCTMYIVHCTLRRTRLCDWDYIFDNVVTCDVIPCQSLTLRCSLMYLKFPRNPSKQQIAQGQIKDTKIRSPPAFQDRPTAICSKYTFTNVQPVLAYQYSHQSHWPSWNI
jgi:hypothetical protein